MAQVIPLAVFDAHEEANKWWSTALSMTSPPEDPIDGSSLDADQRQPTMTLAGWRRFVETPTADFELLSKKRWVALTRRDKEACDEARLTYHAEMIIVATSAGPPPAPFAIPYPIAGNH